MDDNKFNVEGYFRAKAAEEGVSIENIHFHNRVVTDQHGVLAPRGFTDRYKKAVQDVISGRGRMTTDGMNNQDQNEFFDALTDVTPVGRYVKAKVRMRKMGNGFRRFFKGAMMVPRFFVALGKEMDRIQHEALETERVRKDMENKRKDNGRENKAVNRTYPACGTIQERNHLLERVQEQDIKRSNNAVATDTWGQSGEENTDE